MTFEAGFEVAALDLAAFDVAVVGAGPAGLAAAVHAADSGLGVVLVDAGQQPGGQFWRHRDEAGHGSGVGGETEASEGSGHHDWKRFGDLRSRLYSHEAAGRLRYLRGSQLWLVEEARSDGSRVLRLSPTVDDSPVHGGAEAAAVPDSVRAHHLILCPGGYDRQLPVPGWDLPGVMAAGGVQALLKGNMTAPGGTGVVAGTGPFLLPVATALAAAGVKVAAICEANSPNGWLRNVAGVVQAPEKAVEGVEYAAALARHRIPYRTRTAVTEIHGTDKVEAVTLSRLAANGAVVAGTGRRVKCDFVALGWGFTPSLELVLAVGAGTVVDVDGSLVAVVDDQLNSTVPGVSVAGEATGIGGAAMAVVEGELAALGVSAAQAARIAGGTAAGGVSLHGVSAAGSIGAPGSTEFGQRISRLQKQRARLRAFAVAMHRANPVPARWTGWLSPETVVCRCEEVSYGQLCSAHEELGALDARSLKSFARPGMGWCQGRVCGFATAGIAADFTGRAVSADDLRAMSKRTLAAPVSLGRLAALAEATGEPAQPATQADEERTSSRTKRMRTMSETTTTPAELEAILAAAATAAQQWGQRPAGDRAAALVAVADALDGASQELVPLAEAETNLTEARLSGELKRTTFQLRLFAELLNDGGYQDARIDHADEAWPMGARPDIRRVLEPLGPVVVFAASNFPFAFSVAGGDTCSALAAGCSVVLKVHSGHPRLSAAVGRVAAEALEGAGAPSGILQLVYGTQAGRDALLDPRIKAGAFTGSITGGRALFDLANSRPEPIPFYGELGSVNPVFVTEAAAAARGSEIVSGFVQSYTMGAGQFCTKPGILLVPAGSTMVAELAGAARPEPAKLLNERIQSGYTAALEGMLGHGSVAPLGRTRDTLASPPAPALNVTTAAALLKDPEGLITECFGPSALVATYEAESELLAVAGVLDGQLTATIQGEDSDAIAPELVRVLAGKAGRVLWNQWPTGVSVTYAQQHGGPYPATTAPTSTSVGTAGITRFLRPVAYQGLPAHLLPPALRDSNPLGVPQRINGATA